MSTSLLMLLWGDYPWVLLSLFFIWSTIVWLTTFMIIRAHLCYAFVFLVQEELFQACVFFHLMFFLLVFFLFTSHVPPLSFSFLGVHFEFNLEVLVTTLSKGFERANRYVKLGFMTWTLFTSGTLFVNPCAGSLTSPSEVHNFNILNSKRPIICVQMKFE